MQASDTFRSRRPPSPSGARQTLTTGLPSSLARFPQPRYVEEGQAYGGQMLTADEKLEAIRQGGAPSLTHGYAPSAIAGSSGGGSRLGARLGGGLAKMRSGEWKVIIAVVLVACAVRLFRLEKPTSVVFDEVHFGKFAGKYIKARYYVDVHPPLAKLLLTLAAFVRGFDGSFEFKEIGALYPSDVPYVFMRFVPAILGVLLVPATYITLRGLDCSASSSLLGSILVLFENGLITQSRHILLDSPLLFFTGLSTMFWVLFCNEDRRPVTRVPHASHGKGVVVNGPFSRIWWTYLLLTGLSLGAVVSCKWVGLFTIATVGFSTVKQLWTLLGDLNVRPGIWMRHFMARAICLIFVPAIFYMATFEIHFSILRNSGDGDAFMSSEFQHTLDGKGMSDTYSDVAVGSIISIRHVHTQGGYLHSHAHNYPGGSKQQQITLYPHIDANNNWQIVQPLDPNKKPSNDTEDPLKKLTYVTPGMMIRLQHVITKKHLHSHDMRPPVSEVEFQNEVSGYGFEGFDGDSNDNFIVELDEEGGGDDGGRKGNGKGWGGDRESGKRLRTLRSVFKLRHQLTGCYLFSHKVKLPEWGYEQQEVTCNKNPTRLNSLWFIETNENDLLPPDAPKVNYQLPGFFGKFWELQKVMWRTNAGLTSRHAVFDLLTSTMGPKRRIQAAAIVMVCAIWTYAHFSPLVYGNPWTKKHCTDAKWLKTWDFSCNDYLEDYSGYKSIVPAHPVAQSSHPVVANPDSSPTVTPKGGKPVTKVVPPPEVLTKEVQKEKVEPGRNVFEEHALDALNESLAANLALTGANAPNNGGDGKDAKQEEKKKEEKQKQMEKEEKELEEKVGPLMPSELVRVEAERMADGKRPIAQQEEQEGKEKVEKVGSEKSVDATAVEPVDKAQ
ncbi:hypothetical protein FRB91_010642 [Serendipita sp. 411]|nr:hypothetical protein FRB91_010642 [Serendipita sp. 411]